MQITRNPMFSSARFALGSLALLALVIGSGSGCSFSASSESISTSISSPSNSISESSGSNSSGSSGSSQSDESKYRDEVEEYAGASVLAGGGSPETFSKGLSKLAARRGISDWESNPDTWKSIGRGLAKSDLTEAQALAFALAWAGDDDSRMQLMRESFRAER